MGRLDEGKVSRNGRCARSESQGAATRGRFARLARDLMHGALERIDASASLLELLPRLLAGRPVAVCGQGGFVGLLSPGDLIAQASRRPVPLRAADLLPVDTQFCYEDTDPAEADELMRRCGVDRLAVLDHDRVPLGILVRDKGVFRPPHRASSESE